MLKRTRKRRGGDLYAGQLEPAIQAANELATVLQNIAQTLPASSVPAPVAPVAPSVPASTNTAPIAPASSVLNADASSASSASSPASSIKFKTGDKTTGDKTGYIINGNILNTSEIMHIVDGMLKKTPKDQTLLNLNAVLKKRPSNNVDVIAAALNAAKISYNPLNPNVFTMSGGTKKRRMRRTKRKTMRRTKRRTKRKTMRKTH